MLFSPKHLPRLASTVSLFTRYGLADFAKQQGLSAIDHATERDVANFQDASIGETAEAFRRRLVELGPAYVKLGQVLSTRPDLLPAEYIAELEHLQDDVDRVPFEDIQRIVEHELKGRLSKLFGAFDEEPLGSASLGQVHAAELRDGRPVVVKVQRPNIRESLADDLAFFTELAAFLSEHTSAGARVDMVGIAQQLERALADELDYCVEARNAAMFRRNLAQYPRILVPRVIEAYTTGRVLVTERIRGVKVDSISPLARLDHDFTTVAQELTRAYLKQITIDGHFHADPHPGNIFVVLPSAENPLTPTELAASDRRLDERPAATPLARIETQAQHRAAPLPEHIDVKLALIDFGMTARLPTRLREQIVRLLMDLSDNRGDDAAGVLIELADPLPKFEREAFARDIAGMVARNFDLSMADVQTGAVLYEVINTAYQRGLRLPAELTLLAKTLFNLDAVTRALDPVFNPIETIREFGNQIAADRAKQEMNPRRLFQLATQGADLFAALPHRIDLITERMASNQFQLQVGVPEVVDLVAAMQKVANRIFCGAILAGLLVASAMLMPYHATLGTSGFLLAAAIGVWMVITILLSDRGGSKTG